MNSVDPNKIHNRDQFIYQQSKSLADELLVICAGNHEKGSLEFVFGPCFSGKTLAAILLGRALHANDFPFTAAQPAVHRPGDVFEGYIQSRNGETLPATSFSTEQEIDRLFIEKKIVIINEFQFTPEELQEKLFCASMDFISQGGVIIMAGLYYSSLRTVFPFSRRIMQSAVASYELKAICEVCGEQNAIFSQRLINGEPASASTPLFLSVSDRVSYAPRCKKCHIINTT
jgi:thymidine kinase